MMATERDLAEDMSAKFGCRSPRQSDRAGRMFSIGWGVPVLELQIARCVNVALFVEGP